MAHHPHFYGGVQRSRPACRLGWRGLCQPADADTASEDGSSMAFRIARYSHRVNWNCYLGGRNRLARQLSHSRPAPSRSSPRRVAQADYLLTQNSSSKSDFGNSSVCRANITYSVGSRKMPITRLASNPPTITMAKGRCESDPMACENAAGIRPSVATSMVIMMGRKRNTAPSTAASTICCWLDSSMPFRRPLNWLMYSSMITPVCTETPKSARKPTADDTEKFVCVMNSASGPPIDAMITLTRISIAHLNDRNIV